MPKTVVESTKSVWHVLQKCTCVCVCVCVVTCKWNESNVQPADHKFDTMSLQPATPPCHTVRQAYTEPRMPKCLLIISETFNNTNWNSFFPDRVRCETYPFAYESFPLIKYLHTISHMSTYTVITTTVMITTANNKKVCGPMADMMCTFSCTLVMHTPRDYRKDDTVTRPYEARWCNGQDVGLVTRSRRFKSRP